MILIFFNLIHKLSNLILFTFDPSVIINEPMSCYLLQKIDVIVRTFIQNLESVTKRNELNMLRPMLVDLIIFCPYVLSGMFV